MAEGVGQTDEKIQFPRIETYQNPLVYDRDRQSQGKHERKVSLLKTEKRLNLSIHLTEVLERVNRETIEEMISKEMSEHFLELIKTRIYRFRKQKVS